MILVYVGYDFVPYNLCLKRFDACLELRAEKGVDNLGVYTKCLSKFK